MLPEINKHEFKDFSNETNRLVLWNSIMLTLLLLSIWGHYQLVHPASWCTAWW